MLLLSSMGRDWPSSVLCSIFFYEIGSMSSKITWCSLASIQNKSRPLSLITMFWRLNSERFGVLSFWSLTETMWLVLFLIFSLNFLSCVRCERSRISGGLFKVMNNIYKFVNLPMIPLILLELSKKLRLSFSILFSFSVSNESASRKLT